MHLGLKALAAFLDESAQEGDLVLATVVATEGSTYRKPGAMTLVSRSGRYAGMISGGCLEGDLVEHAREVFRTGQPRRIRYDLADDGQAPWSLGLGCGGAIDLLLQRLERSDGWGLLGRALGLLARNGTFHLALVFESDEASSLGAYALFSAEACEMGSERLAVTALARLEEWPPGHRWVHMKTPRNERVLLLRIDRWPRVLICGAGPDALPLARQVDALGWDCTVVDHRPAFANPVRFPDGAQVLCLEPGRLSQAVPLHTFDAAVVMTHNLDHDRSYLGQLCAHPLAYLGLLGPRKRREQLLGELGHEGLEVRGPAGLDLGAELPEAIALSIAAEMHLVLDRAMKARA